VICRSSITGGRAEHDANKQTGNISLHQCITFYRQLAHRGSDKSIICVVLVSGKLLDSSEFAWALFCRQLALQRFEFNVRLAVRVLRCPKARGISKHRQDSKNRIKCGCNALDTSDTIPRAKLKVPLRTPD
jgi:hypothetical protein